MKCPQCGYVSFDYLTACKKCGVELPGRSLPHSQEELAPDPAGEEVVGPEEEWAIGDVFGALEEKPDSGSAVPPAASRLGALAIDLVLLTLTGLLFLVAGEWAAGTETNLFPSPEVLVDLLIPYFMILFFSCFGYFTLFRYLTGQTPGEMVCRLRLEAEDGEPPNLAQAFLHSIGGLLSFLSFGYGFYLAVRDSEGRGWNDRLAGTRLRQSEEDSRRWRDELRRRQESEEE